jgi:general secretion pathway protein N
VSSVRAMRLLGAFLVIASALAARAADPIDARAEFRPPARPAPSRNARQRTGNPLWVIPLSALTATRDRPLFSVSRRPPIVAGPIVAPPPQKQRDPAPPPPEQPAFTLVGTIVGRKASVAVLQGSNPDAISRLRVGEENDGWRVRGIALRSIVVEKGAQSVELELPRPDGAPSAPSDGAPPVPSDGAPPK